VIRYHRGNSDAGVQHSGIFVQTGVKDRNNSAANLLKCEYSGGASEVFG
jgi:hypothetical protein